MGRYIDEILQPGEKVLYSTNAHWMFFLPAIAAWVVALVLFCPVAHDHDRRRSCCCAWSLAGHGRRWPHCTGPSTAWFHRWTTETDVTNLRVVHKTGFIKRRTFEMSLDKVESVDVNQSILGRILELWRRDHHGRRRGQGDHPHHRLAAGVPQFHHRAIGPARTPMTMQPNSSASRPARRAVPSTPPKSRNSQNCRTSGGIRNGKMAPLHKINPLRLTYIRDAACRKFERNVRSLNCLSRPAHPRYRLRRRAVVRAVHPAGRAGDRRSIPPPAISPRRKLHADKGHLSIDYRCTTVEEMDVRERFDIVLAMEVVEHVTDVGVFLNRCAAMLKPGGLMVVSTLNRNWKSFALAIVGAEYVLRWLPRGTHQWNKFVTPDELAHHLADNNLTITEQAGVVYNPLADKWTISSDMDVNYMVVAEGV